MNKLYFGDNLEILREFEPNSIDLICTDPPFNSGRNYNIFLTSSEAQEKAFDDTWKWDDAAQEGRRDIEERAASDDVYRWLDNALKGYDLVLQQSVGGYQGSMRAYLSFMGSRLVELYRVLSSTGSLYLHCDPTASHYLKGILDAIFGNENFRREVIWSNEDYSGFKSAANNWIRGHEILLYYIKSKNQTFNKQYSPLVEATIRRYDKADENGKRFKIYKNEDGSERRSYLKEDRGVSMGSVWTDISSFQKVNNTGEYLDYPTQKPRELYERMIKASSNVGDLVLDPFCGCGTTIDAAETLKRDWIGIDLTILALDPMQKRMAGPARVSAVD